MTINYVSEGSSTTGGTTGGVSGTDFAHDSYSELYAQARPSVTFHNVGSGGATAQTFIDRAAATDAYLTLPAQNMLSVQPMSNTIGQSAGAIDTELALTITYLEARRLAGWWIALMTQAARTDAGYNTSAVAVNAVMRTWIGIHCDALIDVGADPTIGASGGDGTYDGVHLTFANQRDIVLPLTAAVLDARIATGRDRRILKIGS